MVVELEVDEAEVETALISAFFLALQPSGRRSPHRRAIQETPNLMKYVATDQI